MSVFGWHIRDARGRSVSMLHPMILHTLHRSQPIEPDALRSVVNTIEPGAARYRRHLIVITLGSLILVGALFALLASWLYWKSDAAGKLDLVRMLRNPAFMVPLTLPGVACCVVLPWFTGMSGAVWAPPSNNSLRAARLPCYGATEYKSGRGNHQKTHHHQAETGEGGNRNRR